MRIYPKEQVTTIADITDLSRYWSERQKIADEKAEARVSRVAVMLQEFMKQANSVEYWQGERSGRGFVRSWARRIVEVQ